VLGEDAVVLGGELSVGACTASGRRASAGGTRRVGTGVDGEAARWRRAVHRGWNGV
jgi:hypothetical protein